VLASIILVDKVGRRKLFLIGFAAIAGVLLSEALLQWKYLGTDDKPGNAACVFFIFLFIVIFQVSMILSSSTSGLMLVVRRRSRTRLGVRDIPDEPAGQRSQLGRLHLLRRRHHFLNTRSIGLPEYVCF
jgi:hypothetical protein